MTIDLLALANQVAETKIEVELSCGTVAVYPVPEPQVWGYRLDYPAPEQPTVKMKTVGKRPEERLIRKDDKGYSDWLKLEADYSHQVVQLQNAVRFVEALRDIKYPDVSEPPPGAIEKYNGSWPENEILQKKIWLDYTILAKASDVEIVVSAMATLSGKGELTEDTVDEVKKNSVSTTSDDHSIGRKQKNQQK